MKISVVLFVCRYEYIVNITLGFLLLPTDEMKCENYVNGNNLQLVNKI